MDNKDLLKIVERQIRVYGYLLDTIADEVEEKGLPELAEKIRYQKVNYGLGKYEKKATELITEFRIRPEIYEEEAKRQIVMFLLKFRGRKFSGSDVRMNLDGKVTEGCWAKSIHYLIKTGEIKAEGNNKSKKYWID